MTGKTKTSKTSRGTPEDVDAYLAALPEDEAKALQELRETIRKAAPGAAEGLLYKIPVFRLNGDLVAFAAFKNHLSFYVMSPSLVREMKEELRDYKTSGGTIHFSPERPILKKLVRKVVKTRIAENQRFFDTPI